MELMLLMLLMYESKKYINITCLHDKNTTRKESSELVGLADPEIFSEKIDFRIV